MVRTNDIICCSEHENCLICLHFALNIKIACTGELSMNKIIIFPGDNPKGFFQKPTYLELHSFQHGVNPSSVGPMFKFYEGRSICNENSQVYPKVLYLHTL